MKTITSIIFLFILILILHLTTAEISVIGPLDQRNRPAINPTPQRNRPTNARIKARTNDLKQGFIYQDEGFDYSYIPDSIVCNVNRDSPLFRDVSRAIEGLIDGEGHKLRCTYDNSLGDGGNQFCTTLEGCGSAAIAICTTLIKRVDCVKIADIIVAVGDKCVKECDGDFRVGGKVEMNWGNIYVFNSTLAAM